MILEIIKEISSDIKTTIITNGVLADKEFIDNIKGTNTHIVFSIDTIDRDFWTFVRGQDTYSRVFENFYYALDNLNPCQLSVQSVLSKETSQHVKEVGKWLANLGIYHSIQYYISNGFGGTWTEIINKTIESNTNCIAYRYNMSIVPNGDVFTCFQQQLISDCQKPLGNIMKDSFSDIVGTRYFQSVIDRMKMCCLPCKVLKCNIE
jgi:MoaA/NifB/PqqE/SkfB family radical SAM enzyme